MEVPLTLYFATWIPYKAMCAVTQAADAVGITKTAGMYSRVSRVKSGLDLYTQSVICVGELRKKAHCDSDLLTVLYILALITLGSSLLLLCAISIIIMLHFCSLKLTLLPLFCEDC